MKLHHALATVSTAALILAGCGSSTRTTIEGYSDAQLNGRRVFVLLPSASDVRFSNAELFGTSRGVAGASASETLEGELRTVLVSAIQNRLDSNTVLNYAEQAVAGIVPLDATSDFTVTGPTSWANVKRAGQEGAIDYLIVLRDVSVTNTPGSDPRGDEAVAASYALLDVKSQKLMTSGTIGVDIGAPRTPSATHDRLAAELTAKLPFVVVE